MSPLTRGRELKHDDTHDRLEFRRSPLTRGRELKLERGCFDECDMSVAPYAGA